MIALLRRRPEMPCREVVELITDYLEGALPRGERARLERHLAGCPHCTEYLAQMRSTIAITGRVQTGELTAEMQGHLTELYRRWRGDDGAGQS